MVAECDRYVGWTCFPVMNPSAYHHVSVLVSAGVAVVPGRLQHTDILHRLRHPA